jgi:DNA transposition AAA+ family ATPase
MSNLPSLNDIEFLVTKQYQLFAEFCDDCRHYHYIGLCYGAAGVGKTWSARHYAHWDVVEPIPITGTLATTLPPPPPEIMTCRTVVYTPSQTVSPRGIEDNIDYLRTKLKYAVTDAKTAWQGNAEARRSSPRDYTDLIIIDETDRLKIQGLEQLRDIYDRSQFNSDNPLGLIFIGMPGLEKRLARFAQLYSRIGFVHPFKALSREEMLTVLEYYWTLLGLEFNPDTSATKDAITVIIQATAGNFRTIQRLFEQIERVMMINHLTAIEKNVVETAAEMLVVGTA